MKALAEISDLFKIGAEAESKLRAAEPKGSLSLDALVRSGSIGIRTRWSEAVEQRRE
jgi:hypothetical protein